MNTSGLRTQNSGLRLHAALTTVAILFSANYIISKLAMRAFNPLVFAYLRVVGEGIAGATKSLIGDLLIIGNSLAYGLYLVLSKPMMARHSARRVVARMFAIASVVMLPIGIWPMIRQPWAAIPLRAWIGLLLVI